MTRVANEPPRFATWILSNAVPPGDAGASVVGDLHEEWNAQRASRGDARADAWYRREALSLAVSWIRLRLLSTLRGSTRQATRPNRLSAMDAILRDFSYALRSLRRSWRFAVGVVLSLGLAVGLGVPVLSLADHFFLRPPPGVADPDRVVRVVVRSHGSNGPYLSDGLTGLDYGAMTASARALDGVAGWINIGMSLGRGADARSIATTFATPSFFSVLGVRPFMGRIYTDAEDVEGSTEAPCVVSYRFWRRSLDGAADVLGKRFVIGSVIYTVVGVAPEGFNGIGFDAIDVWLPVHVAAPEFQGRDPQLWTTDHSSWLRMVARIKPGVSLAAATADADRVYRTSGARIRDPQLRGTMLFDPLQPGRSSLGSRAAKIALWLSAGGLLLLILVTANLVSLFLARTAAQRHQLAIRRAIGGGWRHLLGLHLAETVILGLCAATIGLLVSIPAVRVTRALILPAVTWDRPAVDLRIALIAFLVATLVGAFVAVWSSLQASRVDPADLLRGIAGGHTTAGRGTHRIRRALLAAQAAIFAILLSGASAFVLSLRRASAVDFGFDMSSLMAASIPLPAEYPKEQRRAVYRRARERIAGLPEVESASLGYMEPWSNNTEPEISVPGSTIKPPRVLFDIATPEYTRTFGVSMVSGRWIDSTDRRGSMPTVVINESLARIFWPADNPIGKCIRIGADSMPCRTIVGVVRDFRVSASVDGPMLPVYYVPMDQSSIYPQTPHLFFRPRGNMIAAERVVRRVLQELEPNLPAVNVHAVRQNVAWMESPLRLGASAFTAFGALAAIVATIGLYSVLSFLVVEQRRAHAVKLALGAQPSRLARAVVNQAMTTVAVGMAIGYVALIPLAAVLEPLLFHTRLMSVQTLVLVTAFGAATALLGALMPVRSVISTDAASILRE